MRRPSNAGLGLGPNVIGAAPGSSDGDDDDRDDDQD